MLSDMESNELAALDDAERARDALATSVEFPRGHDLAIGAAITIQLATAAFAPWASDDVWALAALVGGVLLFGLVAGLQLWRFTRLNGVRVGGYVSQVLGGTATLASFGYTVSMLVAMLAAFRELWWLVGLAAIAGGVVYVLSGRRWLRAYRREPTRRAFAESVLYFAVLGLLAVAGLVLLVLNR
jgi:hypothetical protein